MSEEVFTEIFRERRWRSASGSGSTLEATASVRAALPGLLREFGVRSVLDVPCGDFGWLRAVDLGGASYVGGDVVTGVVELAAEHRAPGRDFHRIDLLRDELPRVDLLLCRDCLVHLSFADCYTALRNIARAQPRLVLLTTFPGRRNHDTRTGGWRTLNLERPPFALPPPLRVVNEGCVEGGGEYKDKSLGLWRGEDLCQPYPVTWRRERIT